MQHNLSMNYTGHSTYFNASLFLRLYGSLRIAFCVWSVLLILHLHAQPPAPNYTLIGKNEGLPEAVVNGLTEDTEGFVWFGNHAALCRWDGHHFQRYTNFQQRSKRLKYGVCHDR